MPVHGDFKRVRIHSQLAQAVGVPPENIFQGENGLPLEITASGASWGERETAGMIFVDGVDIGDVADVALRDRRMLSADGIFIIVATVSEQDGSSVVAPEVLARGVPFLDGNAAFVDDLREAVEDSLDRAAVRADHRDRRARVDAPRRPRELHLRQAQAAPDGAAGHRRGLAASAPPLERDLARVGGAVRGQRPGRLRVGILGGATEWRGRTARSGDRGHRHEHQTTPAPATA